MTEIPMCKKYEPDYTKEIGELVERIVWSLKHDEECGFKTQTAYIYTENSYGGGAHMKALKEVARLFLEKGYYVFLIRGQAYSTWSSFLVTNYDYPEGGNGDYYKKVTNPDFI